MLYRSERNTGCRFHEVIWEGMRTLILENQKLHIAVVLDHGADILEFNYKPTDTDFVWRNPMGLSGLRKFQLAPVDGDMFADNYLGGFFEIVPSVGGGGRWKGIGFGGYCESNQLPWEYEVETDTAERITLRCFVRLNKLPLELTRRIIAERQITCLMVTHNIASALSLGNRTVMMNDGRIVLELAGKEREGMSVTDLMTLFKQKTAQAFDNDRMLL